MGSLGRYNGVGLAGGDGNDRRGGKMDFCYVGSVGLGRGDGAMRLIRRSCVEP
jgi:hypothetical protein